MSKKFWISFVVVFVVFMILDFVIHQLLLSGYYEEVKQLYRPEGEMITWIFWVVGLVFSFFFVCIFQEGYKGTGWLEGLRYGLYIGLMFYIPAAYSTYAAQPIPYYMALLWFIYGTVEVMIGGVVVALIYGKTEEKAEEAPAE